MIPKASPCWPAPVGSHDDPPRVSIPSRFTGAARSPIAVNRYLIAPKLWGDYWKYWDWDKAAREGMALAGLAYSGKYEFVDTVMYWGLTHEVTPADQALSCAACHSSMAKEPGCLRCHQAAPGAAPAKPWAKEKRRDYLNFKALGYPGDPLEKGGRFRSMPLKMASPVRADGNGRSRHE
jgi:hypothetical protein